MTGNPLVGLTLLDEAGVVVSAEELWRDQTAVLVFVRHFG